MITILHNIRSVYNVASCFRTADGAGVEKIYLTGYSPAPIDRFGRKVEKFRKVSLGAEESVPWEKKDIGILINDLKKQGHKILAVEQSAKAVELSNVKGQWSDVCFIFGNEVRGLSKSILKKADKIIEIPMRGRKESLNISVAFGIIVYYFS